MIKINEVRETVTLSSGSVNISSYQLMIDGEEVPVEEANVTGQMMKGIRVHTITISPAGFDRFSGRRPSEFPDTVNKIFIQHSKLTFEDGTIQLLIEEVEEETIVGFRVLFNGTKWKHLWSIREYFTEFRLVADAMGPEVLSRRKDRFMSANNLYYQFAIPYVDLELNEIVTQFFPTMEELHKATVVSVASKVRNDALVASFEFPKEVSVPCEQYLLYFVQFLKDVGVEATADLQHDAGSLLFSVTPASKDVALDNIREALNVYLQLPRNPNIGMEMVTVGDVQTQQLIANVQHFQGQVRLLNATIQLQNATLQQKDAIIGDMRFIIANQQRTLDGNVISESFQGTSIQRSSEDREEILDGVVAFTKTEKFGVEFSTAKAFRWVKALFTSGKPQTLLLESHDEDQS